MNTTSIFNVVADKSIRIDSLVMVIMSLSNIIIFPFYAYCYNINRERDEKTVVFPLTNLLFRIVQISYIPFVYCFGFVVCFIVNAFICRATNFDREVVEGSRPFQIIFYSTLLLVYILHLTTQIVHLIIFILAVERFLIYFCPSINTSTLPKYTISLMKFMYGLLIVKDIVTFFESFSDMNPYILLILYGSVFIFFNSLILLSALLYIPIIIRIRKLTSTNNRQGFWQTITVFGFKIVSIPILLRQIRTESNLILVMVWYSFLADIIIIPVIIQVSYLGCNRKTLKSLFANFKLKTFINIVLNRKPSSVKPDGCVNLAVTNESEF